MTNSPIPGVVARLRHFTEGTRVLSYNGSAGQVVMQASVLVAEAADLIEALHFDVGKYKSRLETVFAEKEALQRELAGTQGALNEMAEELQVICEKHGALGGDRRTAFIGAKLDELQSQASSARRLALEEAALIAESDNDWSRFRRQKRPDALTGEETNVFAEDPDENLTPTQASIMAYRLGIAAGAAIAASIRSAAIRDIKGAGRCVS